MLGIDLDYPVGELFSKQIQMPISLFFFSFYEWNISLPFSFHVSIYLFIFFLFNCLLIYLFIWFTDLFDFLCINWSIIIWKKLVGFFWQQASIFQLGITYIFDSDFFHGISELWIKATEKNFGGTENVQKHPPEVFYNKRCS